MPSDAAERLAASCRQRVGDGLRAVVEYDADGFDVAYVREDVKQRYSAARYSELIGRAAKVQEVAHGTDTEDTPLGESRATVHVFEGAFVFQFYVDERAGYVVGVDTDAGRLLDEFVDACHEALSRSG